MRSTFEIVALALLVAALVGERVFSWWCVRRAYAVRSLVPCPQRGVRAQAIFVHERVDGARVGVVGCSLWESEFGRRACDQGCLEAAPRRT